MKRYGLTEPKLREQLLWQLTVLQFIDERFRGGVVVTDDDVRDYYDEHSPSCGSSIQRTTALRRWSRKSRPCSKANASIKLSMNGSTRRARTNEVEFKQGALAQEVRNEAANSESFAMSAIALGALILVLAIAGVLVVRSAWFQNYVKQIIVTSHRGQHGREG